MAVFTPLLGQLRGKLGGVVFQRGRGNAIARAWVRNIDPHTPAQSYARTRMSQASRRWHALTDAQKADWETYAATFYSPRDGRPPGATYTGQMAYTGSRILALSAIEHAATMVQTTDPPGTTITTIAQQVPTLAPVAKFSATWKIDGEVKTIQLRAAALTPMTQCTITLGWEGDTIAPSAPDPTDQTSGEKWGIMILASLNSRQLHGRQPRDRSIVVVALPPISAIAGWTPADHITIVMDLPSQVMDRLRFWPLNGGAIKLTACGVSQSSGQAMIIGAVTVMV